MNIETLSAPQNVALRQLVDAYRVRCLWSFRADFYPGTAQDAEGVLDAILRYGDREGFHQVGTGS